eukprot:2183331-Lingulodinium_polyedra.AAC.1
MATRVVLEQPKFHCRNGLFADRWFPLTSRLHYAVSSIEDVLMQTVKHSIALEFGDSARVIVYMFDGL